MASQPGQVSRLLKEWRRGDSGAADQVVEAV